MMKRAFWGQSRTNEYFLYQVILMLESVAEGLGGLAEIRADNPQAFDPGDTLTYFPSTATTSACLLCTPGPNTTDSIRVVLFSGTVGTENLQNMVSGFIQPVGNIAYGESIPWATAATDIIVQSPPLWFQSTDDYYFFGHSYGGATAIVLLARMNRTIRKIVQSVVTFGSPRPGNEDLQTWIPAGRLTRWFNSDDPVPHIPPHRDEAPVMFLLFAPAASASMDVQVQPPNGVCLFPDGGYGNAEYWPESGPTLDVSLASWLAGNETFAESTHGLPEYRRRLYINAVLGRPPTVLPAAMQEDEVPFAPTPAVERALVASGTAALATIAAAPQALPPSTPGTTTPRVKARKQGKIWTVEQSGNVIAIGPGKRHAKKLAREFNRSIRAANP
jgi:pimeloyl-ACP methyl ester carboxylesterase